METSLRRASYQLYLQVRGKVQELRSRNRFLQHHRSALVHPYEMKRRLLQIDTQRE
jgi:hypothetical protein